jgi:hypothetical protein
MSACFRSQAPGLVSGQLSGNGRLEERPFRPGFLLPFGRRPSLLGHPVPATEFGSPYGRLTGAIAPDLDGVSMFRTREMRLGKGVLYTPGTAVPTRPRMLRDRHLPHRSGASLISPVLHPAREVMLTRHHQGFPVSRPVPSLPLTCGPRPEREPLGFPASFTPGRYRPRMSRWGQVTDTNPKSRHRHQPASTSTDSLLTCDLTSQALRIPRLS